jgi:drug/metabolite transporter, DME family
MPGARGGPGGGIAAVLAAAVLWGSTGTAAHFAPAAASAASVGAGRIVVGGTLLVLIALLPGGGRAAGAPRGEDTAPGPRGKAARAGLGRVLRLGGSQRAGLGLGVVAVAGYQVCFFSAVRLTGVAIGTMVAIGSAPVFAGLISRISGTAALSGRWAVATAGAIAGCSVLLTSGRSAGVNAGGAGLALLAGLCYATYTVTAARLIAGGQPERPVMAVMFGGGAVLLLPVLLLTSPGWLLTWRGAAVALELGVLATAGAYLLYGFGLRTVQAPVAVTLGLAEPVVATLLAVLLLGERLAGAAIAGMLLVGAALAVLVVPARRP